MAFCRIAMSSNSPVCHPERFHALDATRAFALLLGVVFHIAWFYTPFPVQTPVKDVSANDGLGWLFVASHTFRMQLFFLIAGFFGRLVLQKRGMGVFLKNRAKRILIPLLVAWIFLIPTFLTVWMWGFMESGQISDDVSPLLMGIFLLLSGRVFVPREMGGSFMLVHLWFLYYLILIYLIVLAVRPLLKRSISGSGFERVDGLVSWYSKSLWGPLVLCLFFVPSMYAMEDWSGVTTPAVSLMPVWTTLTVYLGFFGFGWLLHRVCSQLEEFFRWWKVFLVVGLLCSIGLYSATKFMKLEGESGRTVPMFVYADVQDWEALRDSIAKMEDSEEGEASRFWKKLPPGITAMAAEERMLFSDEKEGFIYNLNKLVIVPDLFTTDPPETKTEEPPPMIPFDLEVASSNRTILDRYLKGINPTISIEEPWYRWAKLGFALLYALTTCLLVFGALGFFQRFCQRYSAGWRYVADSSYWVYLVHIPLIPILQILIFRWPLSSWIKFPVVVVVSFVLLYLSYHFLVRSTFIGKSLNGRKYPFQWIPFRANAE